VHVVAQAGAVARRVVGAEERDVRPQPQRRVKDDGHEVGLGVVLLAVAAVGLGAGGVEVAQRHRAQAVGAVGVEEVLDERLGHAVGVLRLPAGLVVDGHGRRLAEDRRGRREDELADPGVEERAGERQGAAAVLLEVAARRAHRLLDERAGREVHDRVGPVGAERGAQRPQSLCPVDRSSRIETRRPARRSARTAWPPT
jgi:hypothetical protein